MKKYAKLFYVLVFCLALSLCGAILSACGEKETTVSVSGEIVFESYSEYDYDTEITLTFTPNEGELNVPAALSYRDGVGREVTAEGFTLVKSGENYTLLDENGQSYALDLVWNSKDPKDDRVTVYGDFVPDKTFSEYEEHEEGERFLLEEGHYGAGKLDASGKQWRFRCEPIRLSDGSELCIYAEADSGADAFVHKQYGPLQFFTQETKDGDYVLYCYLVPSNGNSEEKLLVRDVVHFASDCKKTQPRSFGGLEMFLKYGEVVYAADGFGIEKGDEVFSVYEYQDWEWSDGSIHDFACPAGNLIHVEDTEGDFLIYEYWKYDNDYVCVYFKCDGENVDWESAAPGWHGLRYTKDGKWGTEMFYHMSGDDPVFDAMFAFGPMQSGEVQFFQGADIVKNASGDFTVKTDEGAWHVTLAYGGPEVKLIFTVEEIVTLKGEVVFTHESGNPYDTAIELSYFSGDSERSEYPEK